MKNLMLTAIAASLLASCSTLTSDEAREFQTSMEKANAATQEHADASYNALNDDFAFYNGATGGLWLEHVNGYNHISVNALDDPNDDP